MGVTGSKPTPKRLTRKVLPKAPPPSPRSLTPFSNRKTSSSRSSTPISFDQVYFDKSLAIWTKRIQPALVDRKRAIFYFANSSHYKRIPKVIISQKIFRWFDLHWNALTDFCSGTLDTQKARMRFRYLKSQYEMEQQYGPNFNYNIPITSSPRFERFVEYADNTIVLCIRADGLVEGFAILDMEDDSMKVGVICVGPKKTGIGRIMMEDFKRFAVASGYKSIQLTAVPSAVGFYEKLGFVSKDEEEEDKEDEDDEEDEEDEEDDENDDVDMEWTVPA